MLSAGTAYYGDDDQIVPIGASAMLSAKIVKKATLKIYKGAPHGMCTTLKDQVNADLLEYIKHREWTGESNECQCRNAGAVASCVGIR